jgi:hypothetical protein
MKTVIGLLWSDESAESCIHQLKEVGLVESGISVLDRYTAVRELVGAHQSHVAAKYAFWGALLGIATFGPLGLGASVCECTLLHYGPEFGIGILVAFTVIGTVFGAFIGHFFGVDESQKGNHLYCQGVRLGGKLVAVQASDDLVAEVMRILRQEKALGVETLKDAKEVT